MPSVSFGQVISLLTAPDDAHGERTPVRDVLAAQYMTSPPAVADGATGVESLRIDSEGGRSRAMPITIDKAMMYAALWEQMYPIRQRIPVARRRHLPITHHWRTREDEPTWMGRGASIDA